MSRVESIAARGLEIILLGVLAGCVVALACITYAVISGAVEAASR